MRAGIINIGDEILIGQILNTNAVWMATELNVHGVFVEKMLTIADEKTAIIDAINYFKKNVEIILITGGLGPTKDDITKKTLAEYFGMQLEFHAPSFENIERLFAHFGRKADDRYKIQAHMPVGATVLINKAGTASGMWFDDEGTVIVSMPGVPNEMKYLMSNEVLPRIKEQFNTPTILHKTAMVAGKGETDLSGILENFEEALPENIKLAYLPNTLKGLVRLRLSARGADASLLQNTLDKEVAKLPGLLGSLIYGYDEISMEEVVGQLLKEKNATVGTAESCTGGNIARTLVRIPGSSAYFLGGIVAYSNQMKKTQLGVTQETLDEYGAVSEQTVREMAQGVLKNLGTDYAIAVSGIAGPGGARKDKPVGTIWVAVGNKEYIYTKRLQLSPDRERNIALTTSYTLNTLRRFLIEALEPAK